MTERGQRACGAIMALAFIFIVMTFPRHADAQTTEIVVIGGQAGSGCQGNALPPALSGGIPASGELDYTYDPVAAELTLVIRNTTTVVPGEYTAVVAQVHLNLPPQVTSAVLLSQTQAAGPVSPEWNLVPGPRRANCMGIFGATLEHSRGIRGSIANPQATLLPGPPGSQVLGPVTMVLGIFAPNPAALVTSDFSTTSSTSGQQVVAAMKFMGAGPTAAESGVLGSQSMSACIVQATSVSLGSTCSLPHDPVLTIDPPILGGLATLRVDSDFPVVGGMIFFSFGAVAPTNILGCWVFVDISNSFSNTHLLANFVTDQNGDYEVDLPVPQDPSWLGSQLTFQIHMVVYNGPPTPYYPDWSSNGVLVSIGCM